MQKLQVSDEANSEQIQLANKQGECFGDALKHMTQEEAHGAEKEVDDYLIGYAVEDAEGIYQWEGEKLVWKNPEKENAHIEISVRDAADGRFMPGLNIRLTMRDENGDEVGAHDMPLLWHPWLYHYGRNWELPGDGQYKLHIHIDPPTFHRHDKKNGNRFAEPIEVEFDNVRIKTGQKKS